MPFTQTRYGPSDFDCKPVVPEKRVSTWDFDDESDAEVEPMSEPMSAGPTVLGLHGDAVPFAHAVPKAAMAAAKVAEA